MTTAIIPARGGSKGIKHKNLQMLGGKTLIARAVETSRRVVDVVVVSTDDLEIAKEAARYGAVIHDRPHDLAQDESPTWSTIQLVASEYPDDTFAIVQCTAPLTTRKDIAGTIATLDTGCDLAVACHESHVFILAADGSPINTTFPIPRRQDTEKQFAISGSVWAFRSGHLDQQEMYSGRIGIHVSQVPYRLDIDTPADFALATRLFHSCDYQLWGDFTGGFWI